MFNIFFQRHKLYTNLIKCKAPHVLTSKKKLKFFFFFILFLFRGHLRPKVSVKNLKINLIYRISEKALLFKFLQQEKKNKNEKKMEDVISFELHHREMISKV